jgi:hypothetical protein
MTRFRVACVLLVPVVLCAAPPQSTSNTGSSAKTEALKHDFFALIRQGDTRKFLSYVPERGINIGPQAVHVSRAEIEDQFLHHRDSYCKLFDSSCIPLDLGASARTCSDRELLTQSEKVRTAATETVRGGFRQAILVAEVKNAQCPAQRLIDFIFNYERDGWKLFSAP